MNKLEPLLASHPFLYGMDVHLVDRIANCASYVEFPAGRYILRQGQPANAFYLIVHGSVEVELFSAQGGPVVLQKLGQGSVLGWSWLLEPYRWRFDARVLEAVEAVQVDAVRIRELMEKDPKFGFEILHRFLHIIGDRLESERMRLVDLYASHS